jgi:hypothetical protein
MKVSREGEGERGNRHGVAGCPGNEEGPRFWGPFLWLVVFGVMEKEEAGKRRNK